MILIVDFALKLSNNTSFKRFICLEWILKISPQYSHSQFNYYTNCRSLPLKNESKWTEKRRDFYFSSLFSQHNKNLHTEVWNPGRGSNIFFDIFQNIKCKEYLFGTLIIFNVMRFSNKNALIIIAKCVIKWFKL